PVLALHHFGPCSRGSPSFLPRAQVPMIYGPMPGAIPKGVNARGDWGAWLGTNRGRVQIWTAASIARAVAPLTYAAWRWTIARADCVTVEAYANVPDERRDAVVIPPGIDLDFFAPGPERPKAGRIVAVGSLLYRKGFDVLIRAAAEVVAVAP